MRLNSITPDRPENRRIAFTLAEVVISLAIVATVFGGILVAYTQAAKRAEWSGYSLAAQALAIQQLEQARCAQWDPSMNPYKNDFTNIWLLSSNYPVSPPLYTYKGYTWTNLDLPTTGTNYVRATNLVTIRMLNFNGVSTPNVQFQMIKVGTSWPFVWGGKTNIFTNTICTYVAPDNRDPLTL